MKQNGPTNPSYRPIFRFGTRLPLAEKAWAKRTFNSRWKRAYQSVRGNGTLIAQRRSFRAGWFAAMKAVERVLRDRG